MDNSKILKLIDEYVKKDRELQIEFLKSALENMNIQVSGSFKSGYEYAIKLLTEIK